MSLAHEPAPNPISAKHAAAPGRSGEPAKLCKRAEIAFTSDTSRPVGPSCVVPPAMADVLVR